MNEQKNLLIVLGEWWQQRQANRNEHRRDHWRAWLPTPGNVLFTLLVVGLLLWTQTAGAFPNGQPRRAASASTGAIAYQGRLADANGVPLSGAYDMTFRLYAVATGGAALWTEPWSGANGVTVSEGLLSVMLGSLTPIPQSVFTGNSALFLGISVGADPEMTPRVQMGSVPFAVQALTVPDGSVTATKIADDSVSDRHLNLSTSVVYLGANTGITASASPGQTLLSLSNLAAGTYVVYGLAAAYVDQATYTHGGILFDINDGTNVVQSGPQFYFTEATGWQEAPSAGFMFVITLHQTTTLNLAAHKGPGALTAAVAGGGTYLGYVKIGS